MCVLAKQNLDMVNTCTYKLAVPLHICVACRKCVLAGPMQTHLRHATDLVVVRLFGSRFGSVYAPALQVGILHTQWLTVT